MEFSWGSIGFLGGSFGVILGFCWGCIGVLLYWGSVGVYWGHLGIMEKKIELLYCNGVYIGREREDS